MMLFTVYGAAALAAVAMSRVAAVASTDSYSDADPAQSGYLPNHNMDPAVVDSSEFGQLWKIAHNAQEQFYAKPLVYTPSGGTQIVFLASSQNNLYTYDAKTGAFLKTRNVHPFFLQSEIGCTDIPNNIGIIGTPVIDPATDIAYFFSKTYIANYRTAGNTGVYNGVYYFHGVNVNTLQDVFPPVLIDGSQSDNDPAKYFIGGIVLQRPALTQIGSVVYGGFGGHCDLYNYTGLVVGVDITQQKVVTNFAVESGPLVPQTNQWQQNGGGGQGGIWMSGMALATDGNRLFFVTGNGDGHENQGVPASGSSGCHTLGEACINLGVGDGGVLSLTDYFQPYNYQGLDGGDQDFGSGGIALLDPTVFHGTGVSKMGVTAGKDEKIYILNVNNMGGYRLGPGQTDNVVQTIKTQNSVFGGSGSYPLEGGYIYSTPVGYPTYVYKLGFSDSGVPIFSQVGQSHENSAGRVGVGIPTVTSYQNKPGTGIIWMCDPDAGLRAWYAVPGSDGYLKTINIPQVNGLNKFQRPAFGDTRLYVTDATGVLYCLGSPVNLPLNCTSPVNFGSVALGSEATQTVTCKANIAITSINGATVGSANFEVSNSSLPQGPLAAGATFSFPVTWDLRSASVSNAPNASYGNTSPGVKSTALTLLTTNAVTGYSTAFPISLTGTEVSQNAYLSLTPINLDFGGIVLLDNQTIPSVTLPFVIANAGLSPMTILGYAYTNGDIDDDDAGYTNATFYSNGTVDLGYGFITSTNLPAVGTVIQASSQVSVQSTFTPINGVNVYESDLFVYTSGGSAHVLFQGSASTAPIANFSISNGEGGWLPGTNLLMDFGTVAPGTTASRTIRICDVGGSVLQISKSKPPNGVFRADDPTALHESQAIPVGTCAYGQVDFVTNVEPPNTPAQTYTNTWTLNTDDLTFGVHIVQIQGTVVGKTVGPTNSSGLPVYTYLGCYSDTAPNGRLLTHEPYEGNNNTNGNCQADCLAGNYIFAGTEYQIQCFCGNTPPPTTYLDSTDSMCTFACSGDGSEDCGGVGGYISIYYDATRYTPGSGTSSGTVSGGPYTVNSTGNYNYIGCYSEGTGGRALSALAPGAPAAGFTIESCEAACQGYTYFGTEFSNECYCGNTINAGSVAQTSSDPNTNGCSMACAGNSSEYCGGPNRLDMYQINGSAPLPTTTAGGPSPTATATGGPYTVQTAGAYVYYGCLIDNTNGRALADLVNPESGAGNTVEACATACIGYKYMGVEYGAECYCANTITGGNVLTTSNNPTANGCSMTCAGNSSEYCGGPNRLNAYIINPNATVASSTGVVSATPVPSGPVTVGSFSGWNYLGCYSEATNGRALTGLANPISGKATTVEACSAACSGYFYFGVEYAGECYCGNTLSAGSALVAGTTPAQTQCNMACSGNATEYCGGPNRLNLYHSNGTLVASSTTGTSPTTPTPTGPIVVQTAGSYVYIGCYTEGTNSRALSGLINPVSGTANTVEACGAACVGYTYFGVEYGSECYCGNSFAAGSVVATGGSSPSTNGCSMTCGGNSSEYCGGGNRLNAYQLNPNATFSTNNKTPSGTNSSTSVSVSSTSSISGSTSPSFSTSANASITSFTGSTSSSASSTTTSSITPSSTAPVTVQTLAGYVYLGCYSETSSGTRALSDVQNPVYGPNVTVEACSKACASYKYFGVEYSQECYCGNTINTGSSNQTGSTPAITMCNMLCAGNSSEYCGGPNRLNMYQVNSSSTSSISSSTASTTSAWSGFSTLSSSAISTNASALTTSSKTLTVSSTSIPSAPSSTPISGSVSSSLALTSSATSSLLSSTSNSSISSSTSTKSTSTSSSTTVVPTPGQTINSWAYLGCANETNPRALTGASYTNGSGMTVESCQTFCSSSTNNYGLAGIEYSSECYCGNGLQSYSAVGQTGCNMACSGNASEICGGSNRLSIYNLTTYVPPTTVKAVGSYVSKGCYNEASQGRLLGGANYANATGMTVETCVAYCQAGGAAYAGVEYASECYCGSSLSSGATMASDQSSCNMLCSGNRKEFCGAANLLNVYFNDPSSVGSNGNPKSMNMDNSATIMANSSTTSSTRKMKRGRRAELGRYLKATQA